LARDLLHDRDGALADERDGHRVGADALQATQRAAWGGAQEAGRLRLGAVRRDMTSRRAFSNSVASTSRIRTSDVTDRNAVR